MHKVGIIGAGAVGESHAKAIARVPGLQLAAAARTNPEALASFVARFGGDGYLDYRQLLARRDIDCVCIALPHAQHAEAVVLAAQAGKSILLEKPMATTVEQCDLILETLRDTQVRLMLGHTSRFTLAAQAAKRIIASGELGQPISGWCVFAKVWESARRQPWHRDRTQGGGMWLANGVHLVDRVMWLFDQPVLAVKAVVGTRMHQQAADDTASAFLTFRGGASAAVFAHGYRLGGPDQTTELLATEGMLRYDAGGGLYLGRHGDWQLVPGTEPSAGPPAMEAQWQAFRQYLDDECANPVSPEFGRQVMRVVLAAEEASAAGREVHLGQE